MPGAPSSVRTLLVAMPFPPSSVFAPSIVRIRPAVGSPSVLDRRGDTPRTASTGVALESTVVTAEGGLEASERGFLRCWSLGWSVLLWNVFVDTPWLW